MQKVVYLIALSIYVVLFVFTNNSLTAQVILEYEAEYSIELDNESFLLPGLQSMTMDKEGNLYYCSLKEVLKFDAEGVFQKKISPIGRGPGEFENLIDCETTNNYLVILSFNEFKVFYFNLSDLSFSHQVKINQVLTKQLATSSDSLFFTLSDSYKTETPPSIVGYNSWKKDERFEIGSVPNLAFVGRVLIYGGITSWRNFVFYTFASYSDIWCYDITTKKIKRYKSSPEYFEQSNEFEVNKLGDNQTKLRGYLFSKSRTVGLYSLNQNMIVQAIDTEYPWENGEFKFDRIKRYLEFWDIKGTKLGTGIKTPKNSILNFTNGNKLYFSSNKGFFENVAKANNGEKVKLMEIYRVIK